MKIIHLVCLLVLLLSSAGRAQTSDKPFLHPLFADDMVFPRDIAAPVWGWTVPGHLVVVSMGGRSTFATAGDDGRWMARLGPFGVGAPMEMTVSDVADASRRTTLHNVVAGDVWLCSGQSNMEFGIGRGNNAEAEIAGANFPNIRLFTVPKKLAISPQPSVEGRWQVCTPQSVAEAANHWSGFSAVGYFFGRELHQTLNVPIGLIQSAWGGTPAQAWTSREALLPLPDYAPQVARFEELRQQEQAGYPGFDEQLAAWWQANDAQSGNGDGWIAPNFDDAAWKTMNLPVLWERAGLPGYDGTMWFRKSFDLPASWDGQAATLNLGVIDDDDTTWLNGTQVGATQGKTAPRSYAVAPGVLKAGRNVIVVRVNDTGSSGGFAGTAKDMTLQPAPGAPEGLAPVSLSGAWKFPSIPYKQRAATGPNEVTAIYNQMIAPLIPFAFKGAIWYQGESNAGQARQYRALLPALIRDWRGRFGTEFPFLIVQLANYQAVQPQPSESNWAMLREAQLMTSQTVPATGLAVAIDIGEAGDIHPKNKQDVGHRLALSALAKVYGQPVEYSGPAFRTMRVEGRAIRLTFDHAQGLTAKGGGELQGFAIAGADKKFVWAQAKIDGDSVLVSAPQVAAPVAVRYAWANNPIANLTNATGLPASSFRTDVD